MSLRNLFDPGVCEPRKDVLQGTTRDEQFAADLAQVVNQRAPPEYGDPATFFSNTFPTRGIQHLLKAVCSRLTGRGGEVSPLIRLHTQFGGGKTHGLIALVHAARGQVSQISNIAAFVDPALLPTSPVAGASADFQALEKLRRLAFAEEIPAPKIPEQEAFELADGMDLSKCPAIERVWVGE